MKKMIITIGICLLLFSVILIPIINAQKNSIYDNMKRPILYHGFVWGKYIKIEKTGFWNVEVRGEPGELKFQFCDVTWLDIVFFFGYAKNGRIFGFALFTYVMDWY